MLTAPLMTDSTYTTVAVHSNADMVNAVRVVIALAAEHVLLQALARALDLQYSSFQFVVIDYDVSAMCGVSW